MDSLQNQSLSANLRDRERHRLDLLRKALERMDDGSYGLCADCGAGVEFGRLFVVPESTTCGRCGMGAGR
jgi:DnaK suppressor protein